MEMPLPFDLASNAVFLFALLTLLTSLFIYLFAYDNFIFKNKFEDIQWKRVDYVWLLAASLGLIGQAQQLRIDWFTTVYRSEELNIQIAAHNLQKLGNDATGKLICRTPTFDTDQPLLTENDMRQLSKACIELEIFKSTGPQSERISWKMEKALSRIHEVREHYTNAIILQRLDNLSRAYSEYDETIRTAGQSKHETYLRDYELLLKYFSPYLFVFALALRLSKVHGEIRLKKPATAPSKKVEMDRDLDFMP